MIKTRDGGRPIKIITRSRGDKISIIQGTAATPDETSARKMEISSDEAKFQLNATSFLKIENPASPDLTLQTSSNWFIKLNTGELSLQDKAGSLLSFKAAGGTLYPGTKLEFKGGPASITLDARI
jgi:hypothetical protein